MKLKIRIKRIDSSDFFLECGFLLLALNFLFYQCFDYEAQKDSIRIVALGLMAVSAVLRVRTFRINRTIFLFMLFSLFPAVVWEASINWAVILVIIVICYGQGEEKLKSLLSRVSTVTVVVYFLLRFMGVIEDVIYLSGERLRNTLGFFNVNAACLFLFSWAMIIFCRDKKGKVLVLLAAVILIWALWKTNTRSMLVVSVVFLLVSMVLTHAEKHSRNRGWRTLAVLLIIGEIAVIALSVLYPVFKSLYPVLDEFLSYRFSLGARAVMSVSFREWIIGGGNGGSDNYFHVVISQYGVINLLISLLFVSKATWRMMMRRDVRKVAMVFSLWIMSTMETFLFRPEIMVSVLFWFMVFKEALENPMREEAMLLSGE